MSAESSWQSAFVVVTVSLGDSVDAARASLTPEDSLVAGPTVDVLTGVDRAARTRTLTAALTTLGLELEALRLA